MAKSDKKSTEEEKETERTTSNENTEETVDNDKAEASESTESKKDENEGEQSDKATETEPEKTEEKPKELSEEEIYKILKSFNGVGQVMAERIYKAGFDSRETLLEISIDDLKKIRGIGHSLAETIADGMEKAIKDLEEPIKPKDAEKKEGPGITDKAMGFLKGSFSKLTSFFKGKKPQKTSAPDDNKPEPAEGGEVEITGGSVKSDADEAGPGEAEKYPEVSAPEAETKAETEIKSEPETKDVNVEGSEIEQEKVIPTDHLTEKPLDEKPEPELEPEPKAEIEPEREVETEPRVEPESSQEPESKGEPEPVQPTPDVLINLKDASGLLLWFESTPGLRPEAGRIVFKAGYNNLEELKEAVVEDLILINGINESEANNICSKIQDL